MKSLTGKILEKNGQKAVLEIEKQKINLSSDRLPASAVEGSILKVYLLNPEQGVVSDKNLAKTILEEILNGQ
ncbi:MAG TPA: hypothetical protein VJK26_03800 [Patescibacteria group bacterium]|nr:hypothetical protein [Patescibacteria group bacterium]